MHVADEVYEWGQNAEHINAFAFTWDAWERSFLSDVTKDMAFLSIAVVLVFSYTLFVLGNLSPIHFRSVIAVVGICCVFLGAATGYAVAFFLGLQTSNFHNILPFMVIGIGVDDMFVIVNTVD